MTAWNQGTATAGVTFVGGDPLVVSIDDGSNSNYAESDLAFAVGGKIYMELTITTIGTIGTTLFGLAPYSFDPSSDNVTATYAAIRIASSAPNDGDVFTDGTTTVQNIFDFNDGDVVSIAADVGSGKVWIGQNGVWYNSGDPAAGTNPTTTSVGMPTTGVEAWFFGNNANGTAIQHTVNFDGAFAYTVPTGFGPMSEEFTLDNVDRALITTRFVPGVSPPSQEFTNSGADTAAIQRAAASHYTDAAEWCFRPQDNWSTWLLNFSLAGSQRDDQHIWIQDSYALDFFGGEFVGQITNYMFTNTVTLTNDLFTQSGNDAFVNEIQLSTLSKADISTYIDADRNFGLATPTFGGILSTAVNTFEASVANNWVGHEMFARSQAPVSPGDPLGGSGTFDFFEHDTDRNYGGWSYFARFQTGSALVFGGGSPTPGPFWENIVDCWFGAVTVGTTPDTITAADVVYGVHLYQSGGDIKEDLIINGVVYATTSRVNKQLGIDLDLYDYDERYYEGDVGYPHGADPIYDLKSGSISDCDPYQVVFRTDVTVEFIHADLTLATGKTYNWTNGSQPPLTASGPNVTLVSWVYTTAPNDTGGQQEFQTQLTDGFIYSENSGPQAFWTGFRGTTEVLS